MNDKILLITSLISGFAVVLASLSPIISLFFNKKQREEAEANKRRFAEALNDIEYLYALAELYEEEQKVTFGESSRRDLSKRLMLEQGLSWSGRHSPSRIAYYRKLLNKGA